MGFTTITIKRETYSKLLKVKAEMQMEKAASVSFTDVLEELIQLYYKYKSSFLFPPPTTLFKSGGTGGSRAMLTLPTHDGFLSWRRLGYAKVGVSDVKMESGEAGRKSAYAVIVPKTMPADLDVYMFDTREEVKAFLSGTLATLRSDIEGIRPELTDIAFLIASAKHAKITRNFYGTVLVLEYDESKYLSFFRMR